MNPLIVTYFMKDVVTGNSESGLAGFRELVHGKLGNASKISTCSRKNSLRFSWMNSLMHTSPASYTRIRESITDSLKRKSIEK